MSRYKSSVETVCVQCQRCSVRLPGLITLDKGLALEIAKRAGWVHLGDDEDYCSGCAATLLAAAQERSSNERPLFGSKLRHFLDAVGIRGCKATTETKE